MIALVRFFLSLVVSLLKPKLRLAAENAALRHQLIVLRRKMRGRAWLTNNDRWFFIQMYAGFHRSCRSSRSSVPRRWCVGIGPAFATIGVGSRAHWEGGPKSRPSCAR